MPIVVSRGEKYTSLKPVADETLFALDSRMVWHWHNLSDGNRQQVKDFHLLLCAIAQSVYFHRQ
jgi:hypothetical protein